jgi:hypothetical protein
MNSINKAFGIFLAAFLVLTAVPALFFFNFDQRAFTSQTYRKAFASADFYNQLPAVLTETMFATTGADQMPGAMHGMSRETWESFFRATLSPQTIQQMGDETLNSIFAYLNLQSNSIQISLAPLKVSMSGDAGVQAVFALLKTQPDCTMEQMTQASMSFLNDGKLPLCNPPADLIPVLTPLIQGQMQVAAQSIPDQLTLFNAPPGNDPRLKLQAIRLGMRFSPVLPLGLLLLLTIAVVRSLKDWLTWWGIPLCVAGFLTAITSVVGAPIFGVILRSVLTNHLPGFLPSAMLGYVSALTSAMLQALLLPTLWQGLAITFIGLGMTAAGYLVKGRAA